MTVRWSDLPPNLKAKTAPKPRRLPSGGCAWRCHACGNVETAYARAERHADANRHTRIECIPSPEYPYSATPLVQEGPSTP